MNDNMQEFIIKPSKVWRALYVNRIWFVVFGILAVAGIYVGYLLFGGNSVEVLLRLQAQKRYLVQNTQLIEVENARLQKQIFELRGLKP